MKKLTALPAAVLAAVTLTACGTAAQPAHHAAKATPADAPTPTVSSFCMSIDGATGYQGSAPAVCQALTKAAHQTCHAFSLGLPFGPVYLAALKGAGTLPGETAAQTQGDVAYVIGASVGAFCPQYAGVIQAAAG